VRDEAERNADGEAVEVDARRCCDAVGVTVGELLAEGEARLERHGIETARLDTELLLEKALGLSRAELYLVRERALADTEVEAARELLERRARREPLAYVLGEWGFRRLTPKVDPRVLVPRPETEVVAGRCLELLRGLERPRVLDVGTGSGAIALAVADEHPGARVTGIDVSEDALALARENAARTGIAVEFERGNLREALVGAYDLVVSNPPYVSAGEIDALEPEVRDWEPRLATVGDGHTEAVARGARTVIVPGGWLVLEVADGRAGEVSDCLQRLGYEEVGTHPDLTGRERVVEGRWTSSSRL
jgi:release factor glutamine methyltransferase